MFSHGQGSFLYLLCAASMTNSSSNMHLCGYVPRKHATLWRPWPFNHTPLEEFNKVQLRTGDERVNSNSNEKKPIDSGNMSLKDQNPDLCELIRVNFRYSCA
ncbi:hypothetical protein BDN72DRAFT_640121 [Pluteus cervinus]|uniref:Uncharacterized protein n=1 Tax=Pluteus cervinus TaxID=181527 RepID=A0ACD3AUW2_9AGAR|nr:hypothetical protein BDN72DRAFT_640121 [Pluteus cervinus]